MTKILLSAIVTDMRNSTAGSTFTKNRYGNVLKKKPTPIKQTTIYQNYWRQGQAGIAKSWRTLTEANRQSWIDGASNFPYQDQFGNTMYLSGFALYQKLNLNLAILIENPIATCPVAAAPPAMNDFLISATWNYNTQVWGLTAFASSGVSTVGYEYAIYATQQGSQGKMVAGKTIYFIQAFPAPDEEADISQFFNQFMGIPVSGQKTFFQVAIINTTTGQRGVSLTYSLIFPPVALTFMATLTSGISFNFFSTFFGNGFIIPSFTRVEIDGNTGATPAPANPAVLVYFSYLVLNSGTTMNPYSDPSEDITGTTNYIWFRMRLKSTIDNRLYSTLYSLVLFEAV